MRYVPFSFVIIYKTSSLSNYKSFFQIREEIQEQILSPMVNKMILDVVEPKVYETLISS